MSLFLLEWSNLNIKEQYQMVGRFLGGIGALIMDRNTDRYLLLKRSKDKDYAADVWECVTGRVDQGEGFEDALHREVMEEIGIEVDVEFLIGTSHFYRGAAVPENELIGVIYCCSTDTPDAVKTSVEHSEHRWVPVEEALRLADKSRPVTSWLHRVIIRAELMRTHVPEDLLKIFRDEGFETDEEQS